MKLGADVELNQHDEEYSNLKLGLVGGLGSIVREGGGGHDQNRLGLAW